MNIILDTEKTGRLDITDNVITYSFSTRNPGGWIAAEVELPDDSSILWNLEEPWLPGKLEFFELEEIVWGGYINEYALSSNLKITAVGTYERLDDTEVWRAFADSQVTRWSSSGDNFSFNKGDYLSITANDVYTKGETATFSWPNIPLNGEVRKIEGTLRININSGSWQVTLTDDNGNIIQKFLPELDTPPSSEDIIYASEEVLLRSPYQVQSVTPIKIDEDTLFGGALSFNIDLAITPTPSIHFNLISTGTRFGEAEIILENITIRTLPQTTGDAILEELFTQNNVDIFQLDSATTLDQAVYIENQTIKNVIEDIAFVGDGTQSWVCVIYSDAFLNPWPNTPTWLLHKEDTSDWSLTQSRSDIFNSVRVNLPDGYFTPYYEDATSIELYGKRERTFSLEQTTHQKADEYAQILLEENKSPLANLNVSIDKLIRRLDGNLFPVSFVRAGDTLRLRDFLPYQDVDVKIAETTLKDGFLSIYPVGVETRLEIILATEGK